MTTFAARVSVLSYVLALVGCGSGAAINLDTIQAGSYDVTASLTSDCSDLSSAALPATISRVVDLEKPSSDGTIKLPMLRAYGPEGSALSIDTFELRKSGDFKLSVPNSDTAETYIAELVSARDDTLEARLEIDRSTVEDSSGAMGCSIALDHHYTRQGN